MSRWLDIDANAFTAADLYEGIRAADSLARPLDPLIPDLCRDLGLTTAHLREAEAAP